MNIKTNKFKVPAESIVDLSQWPTQVEDLYKSKKKYKKFLKKQIEALSAQQQLQYADNSHSLLLIFQAMEGNPKQNPEFLYSK